MTTRTGVFLSYAGDDRELCNSMWADLRAAARTDTTYDFRMWSMDDNLLAGDAWHKEIVAALDSSALGVFAVSHAMLNSEYIQSVELAHYLDSGKPFVPVLLTQINSYADLRGLKPSHVFGWGNAYEEQTSRAKKRKWATTLAEELHRIKDRRSA